MVGSLAKIVLLSALLAAAAHASPAKGRAEEAPSKTRLEPPPPPPPPQQQELEQEPHQEPERVQPQQEQVQVQEQEPERVFEDQHQAEAEPYAFSYNVEGSSRSESGDTKGVVRGYYRLAGPDGSSRLVEYIADHHGFRATVNTNELGTEPQSPASVAMRSSQPLASVAAVQAAAAAAAAPPVVAVAAAPLPVVHAPLPIAPVPVAPVVPAPLIESAGLVRAAAPEYAAAVKGRELVPPPPAPLAAAKGRELPPPPPPKGYAHEEVRKQPVKSASVQYQRLSPSRASYASATRHSHVYPSVPRAYQYNRPIYASVPQVPRRQYAQPGVASFYSPSGLDDEQPIGFDV